MEIPWANISTTAAGNARVLFSGSAISAAIARKMYPMCITEEFPNSVSSRFCEMVTYPTHRMFPISRTNSGVSQACRPSGTIGIAIRSSP